MERRGIRGYMGFLTPIQISKRLVDSAIDFGYAVRQGMILGYYDAKHHFHRISKEENPMNIIRNAATITLAITPGGTIFGPVYLIWKGSIYLLKIKNKKRREKESELVGKM